MPGTNNFTGHPLPGYDARRMRAAARGGGGARACRGRSRANSSSALKVYDCYRPTRAVAAFARWAQSADDGATKRFYPKLGKRRLFALGYIASHSAHSTGIAVDLTLVPLPAPPAAAFDPRAPIPAPCTAPAARARQSASTWAPASTASTTRATRQARRSRRPKAPPRLARRRHAQARLPQLFPRMVALHLRGARTGLRRADRAALIRLRCRLLRQQLLPARQRHLRDAEQNVRVAAVERPGLALFPALI